MKHFQHHFFTLVLFGGNEGIEIAKISCAGILLGDKTALCDGLEIILGWAELTSMLSCNGLRNHHPHPHQAFSTIWVGVIYCLLGGSVCEALSL